MNNCIKQNTGIDVSKDKFDVCLSQLFDNHSIRIKGTRKFKNTVAGFKNFVAWAEKKRHKDMELHITLEATGVYYESLAHFLHDKGYLVSVMLPNKTKAFFKSLNIKTKTDRVDAKILGRMGLERQLEQWQPFSDQMRTLKALTRERKMILEEKTAILNRLHAQSHSYQPQRSTKKRFNQRLRLITKQLIEVENLIKKTVEADPELTERIEKICMLKGLGLITVAIVIAETNGFVLFKNRAQLVSYAGYDVVHNQSGSSINGKTRISKKGNRYIRSALHFPAISAVKHEEKFRQLYQRVFDKTTIKMKGYVAVQRKLLIMIYTLFKKNEAYDSNFDKKQYTLEQSRQDTRPAYAG